MSESTTIEEIRSTVAAMDPNLSPEDDAFGAACILLALLTVEHVTVRSVVEFTELPWAFVAPRMARLRRNGVLRPARGSVTGIHADWGDQETGGAAFWCDVCVAEGLLGLGRAR